MRRFPTLVALLSASLLPATAQEPQEPALSPALLAGMRVPVHGSGDATGPDHGIWTAGPDYKASFHDGFAFYPVLGPKAPRNLPLHWRTTTVRQGAFQSEFADVPAPRCSEWRVEFEHRGLREVYEVRTDGVEQLFVLDQPLADGDLTITGKVTTELEARVQTREHGALTFCQDGVAILRYGAAVAIDALGDRVPVATSWDGDTVSLHVPGAWIATARYPITVDPLTSTVLLSTGSIAISSLDIGHDAESTSLNLLTAYSRAVSATDHDVYAILSNRDFGSRSFVFSDTSVANSDKNVTVAYVAATDRWMVGFQREAMLSGNLAATIRIYFHDRGVSTLNSGLGSQLLLQPTFRRNPDLGGATGGTSNYGFLVYQVDPTSANSNNTDVFSCWVPAHTRAIGTPQLCATVASGTRYDRENPCVNQAAGPDEGWVVAWQELDRNTANDDWDLWGMRTDEIGNRLAVASLLSVGTRHALTPQIAGATIYMLTMGLSGSTSSTANTELAAMPLTWIKTSATPVVSARRTVATAFPPQFTVSNHGLAFDARSNSHWAMSYTSGQLTGLNLRTTARVVRLGYSGGITEATVPFSNGTNDSFLPAVTFNSAQQEFPLVFNTDETTNAIYGRILDYPADAVNVLYGTGCGLGTISGGLPYAGNRFFRPSIFNAPPFTVAILFMALGAGALPLDGVGMPGCVYNTDPTSLLLTIATTTASGGQQAVGVPLPDAPVVTGDLHFQFFYLNPGANPANLQATRGMRSQVR